MDLQASWLAQGYFQVTDQMQQIRDGLAARLGRSSSALQIAFFPVGPVWKHTYWWREGEADHAEAQFFARISREYPILSLGVSVEKGLEDSDAAPFARRHTFLMNRRTWDWERLKGRMHDVLKTDVPACASLLERPFVVRFSAQQWVRGAATAEQGRRTFVLLNGRWFERYVGTATESAIAETLRGLDERKDWWVNAYFGCDLSPHEVTGMKPEDAAHILWQCSAVRRRLTSTDA